MREMQDMPPANNMGDGDEVAALQSPSPTNPYADECTQNWDVTPYAKHEGYRLYVCTYDGGACKYVTMTKDADTSKIETHIQQHRTMREALRKLEQKAARAQFPGVTGAGLVRPNGRPF